MGECESRNLTKYAWNAVNFCTRLQMESRQLGICTQIYGLNRLLYRCLPIPYRPCMSWLQKKWSVYLCCPDSQDTICSTWVYCFTTNFFVLWRCIIPLGLWLCVVYDWFRLRKTGINNIVRHNGTHYGAHAGGKVWKICCPCTDI